MKMKGFAKMLLWGLAILAAGITFYRWAVGLGAVTHLSDSWPWGLWIGFDLLCGVALAAGGFTTAAVVYIFHREKYHPVARAAILTAFLGYVLVVVALLVDLGRPWAIIHMMWMWNPHSVLFEVGCCVLLYLTVLALEFAPVVLEKWSARFGKVLDLFEKVKIALVIAGICLSTLHQSSLGSLFLAAEHRQNALWFSPMLPVFFFLSAVMVGPAMVIVESNISSRALGKQLEKDVLEGLAGALPYLAGLYLLVKFLDLALSGDVTLLFESSRYATLFWIEILLPVAAILILMSKSLRKNPRAVWGGASLIVVGVVVNRLNVCLASMPDIFNGRPYFPSWQEFAVTIGVLSAGVIAYGLVAKYFKVFEEQKT
jgi:Ni/Fe-hydrogenase subunit HybB-like protein